MVVEKILYFDIESWTGNTPNDFLTHTPRYIGFYCSDINKYFIYHITQEDKIIRMFKRYKYIAGHNCIEYDIPVLKKIPAFRYMFKNKVIFDTMKIIDKRAKTMLYYDFSLTQRSLEYQTKFFNLVDEKTQKGTFDYSLMKRKHLLPRDLAKLKDYLKRDLMSGFLLFKFYYDMFFGFRDLHSPKNVTNGLWLNAPSGKNSNEIICYKAGIKPTYDYDNKSGIRYEGAYVKLPVVSKRVGKIFSFDFASLYPHIIMMFNLFSPCNEQEGYNLIDGIFKNQVKGNYKKESGSIELVIREAYLKRVDVKKLMKTLDKNSIEYSIESSRQLTLKILINSAYGVLGSTYFPAISNLQGASNVTKLAKLCIQYAEKMFEEYGFEVLYADTDSNYIYQPVTCFNDPYKVAKLISDKLRNDAPIYIDTFNFAHEHDINYIHFFKDDAGVFKKKHYIYQTKEGKITFKGVGLVGGQLSPVFNEYKKFIIAKVKRFDDIITTRSNISEWLKNTFKTSPKLFTKRFRAKEQKMYKIADGKQEATSIQAQISRKYGVGEHHLVPNLVIGAGKGVHYCKLEELQEAFGDEWVKYVDYEKFINELKPFINVEER